MGKKAIFVLGLLMGLTGCYSLKPPSIPILAPSLPPIAFANETQLAQIEQTIYKEINQYRQSRRLPPLKLHRQISQQARLHSQHMASQVTPFGHQGFSERAETIGLVLPYQNIAENVAINQGYQDPATVAVKGWLESPGHLQNIQGNFNLTGIGVSQDGEGKYYFTQIFLKQRAPNSPPFPRYGLMVSAFWNGKPIAKLISIVSRKIYPYYSWMSGLVMKLVYLVGKWPAKPLNLVTMVLMNGGKPSVNPSLGKNLGRIWPTARGILIPWV
ncbi:MAG: hypothetical protein RLZZ148_278 [Cyanobacteriota bacterium]